MTIKEAAYKVEDFKFKSWVLSSQILALSEALLNGFWDVKAYEGAMHAVQMAARELTDEAESMTDELFASLRAERERNGGDAA